MRAILELTFGLTFLRWAEWDGENETYLARTRSGNLILADSLALLISELQARSHRPLALPMAA